MKFSSPELANPVRETNGPASVATPAAAVAVRMRRRDRASLS
jgi:hypothetical protein